MLLLVGEDGVVKSVSETPMSVFGFAPGGVVGVSITTIIQELEIGALALGGVYPLLELLATRYLCYTAFM